MRHESCKHNLLTQPNPTQPNIMVEKFLAHVGWVEKNFQHNSIRSMHTLRDLGFYAFVNHHIDYKFKESIINNLRSFNVYIHKDFLLCCSIIFYEKMLYGFKKI